MSYTYDNNGNQITKTEAAGRTTYAWDAGDRLTQVTLPGAGGTVTFAYDPFGRRIKKASSAGTAYYLYDGAALIEEVNASGTAVARYVHGLGVDEPLVMLRGTTTSYYHADGLGSVTSLTTRQGAVAATYTYDAFGVPTATTGTVVNPFRYTGREWDAETGLYYYRARYYDARAGRFISEDPIGFQGGVNFFSYVANRPLILTDPLGLLGFDEFLYHSAQFSAGFGDTVSLGLSAYIRQQWGFDDVVDRCSAGYSSGVWAEIAAELGGTGASFALRGLAKGISQAAARSGMSSEIARGVRGVSELHHINPLKAGLLPTAALPASIRHGAWNLELSLIEDHRAAHGALKRAEGYLKAAFNPATTGGRLAGAATDPCGCR